MVRGSSSKVEQEEQEQVSPLLQGWLLLLRLTLRGTGQPAWIACVATLTNKRTKKQTAS